MWNKVRHKICCGKRLHSFASHSLIFSWNQLINYYILLIIIINAPIVPAVVNRIAASMSVALGKKIIELISKQKKICFDEQINLLRNSLFGCNGSFDHAQSVERQPTGTSSEMQNLKISFLSKLFLLNTLEFAFKQCYYFRLNGYDQRAKLI